MYEPGIMARAVGRNHTRWCPSAGGNNVMVAKMGSETRVVARKEMNLTICRDEGSYVSA